ncbi:MULTISPECIES: hypothetical protein [unclassified Thioalkalivibrio]|uniref:hypothetical protein n=1 Tax=unclassified Thioalkalivibrio TaxID=2621013 RepID=UPI0003646EFE|nr:MULTISPECIES: hypothetical protein [unclassified Thioalkalivibrio]
MMNGTITRTLLAGAAIAALSGCIVIEDIRPTTSSSTTTGTAGNGVQNPSEDITFSLTTQLDVDTTYARLRREFDFPTLDERAPKGHRQREWIKLDAGFHHRTQPGVTYSMRSSEAHDGHNGIMQIDIDREGSGAYVEVLYHARDNDQYSFPTSDSFQSSLRERVQGALR